MIDLIYRLKLLLKANIPLGIFHFIRRKVSGKEITSGKLPYELVDIFHIREKREEIADFFEEDAERKKQLLEIADNFVLGDVSVYQKTISLKDYTTDKFHASVLRKDIFHKDIRFHWEIYRSKYLFNVGLAYYLTKKESYAKSLIDYIKDLSSYSPVFDKGLPYNGMEAAIKLINLSWLDVFLADSPNYIDEVRNALISSIVFHVEYVYKNYDITFYGLESNHGLTCAVGLIYASLLFPKYGNSKKWRRFGMRVLRRSLRTQFSKDGVNFESSVQYHRFVFELLIFLLAALYKANSKVDANIEEKIKRIGESLKALTHRNGYISRIGDSDGGKFFYDLGSSQEFNSMKYLNWFLPNNENRYYETLQFENVRQIKAFFRSKSGFNKVVGNYFSYKDSNISLVVSGNEIGTRGKGNHQHNDFLSFELYSASPFIVDPWSYCYTGDKDLRNNDRQTKSHNTIEIDGRDIVEFNPNRLFEMLGNIDVNIEKVVDKENTIIFELSHNGYKNLANGPQIHTRKFTYDKNSTLQISDILSGNGKHTARYYLHIHKEHWELEVGNNELIFFNDKERFILRSNLGESRIADCFVSESFLTHVRAYLICFEQEYENNLNIELVVDYEKRIR